MRGQLIIGTSSGLIDDLHHPGAKTTPSPELLALDRREGKATQTAIFRQVKDALSHLEQLARNGPVVVVNNWPTDSSELTQLLQEIAALVIEASPLSTTPVGQSTEVYGDKDVEITILGATEVLGIEGSLVRRPKLTELIIYLAMHPEGATTSAWSNALWPDRRVPPQTIANRLSEARRELGVAKDGLPRLRRKGDKHTVVEVSSDWALFLERAKVDGEPSSWHRALELVKGRPFAGLQQGQWTVLEGFVAEIEEAVVDCALRLGEQSLGTGNPDLATFAAQRALRANPWDERLHRLLMRSADASGNRGAINSILQHLALILEIDGDPLHGVHPETAELYAQLSGRIPPS